MQLFPHLNNDDTAFTTVHLSKEEYADLRNWMHTDANGLEHVTFPHGVKLYKRGFGWYRLDVTYPNRTVEKIKTAMTLIRKWSHDFQRRVVQETRVLLARQQGHKVHSYHSDVQAFRLLNSHSGKIVDVGLPAAPASEHKLQALVNKFANR